MKSLANLSLGALIVLTSLARAGERLSIGNFSITGGGMQLIGTISTLSLDDKHPAFTYVGWSLIVVGSLVNNQDLVVGAAGAETLPAPQVWSAMVRQAKVVADNPSLVSEDFEIANAARSLNVSTSTLARITLEIDLLTKDNSTDAQAKLVEAKFFVNGEASLVQRQAINNMIALASMR